MKCDHFYGGLNPKYQWMLVHKLDGENWANYSDLLPATSKLERRAEARDPLPQKTVVTSGLNAIHSQTPGNLFPLCKWKGNHTFTIWAATIGNAEGEADSGAKQEGEGEMEPLAHKEVKASGRAEGTESAYGVYHLLHQGSQTIPTEKQKLFWVWESWPPHAGLPEILANLHGKEI